MERTEYFIMPLVDLSPLGTITLDIMAWFIIHMGISWVFTRLSSNRFETAYFPLKINAFETRHLYESVLKVKAWKSFLPDAAVWFTGGFAKKSLAEHSHSYFQKFIVETRRGELAHWATIAWAPLFILWNPPWVGLLMLVYAFGANMPCIIVQRYNRLRLESMLSDTYFDIVSPRPSKK